MSHVVHNHREKNSRTMRRRVVIGFIALVFVFMFVLLLWGGRIMFLISHNRGRAPELLYRLPSYMQEQFFTECLGHLRDLENPSRRRMIAQMLLLAREHTLRPVLVNGRILPDPDPFVNQRGYSALVQGLGPFTHTPAQILAYYENIFLEGLQSPDSQVQIDSMTALVFIHPYDVELLELYMVPMLSSTSPEVRRYAVVMLPLFTGAEPWRDIFERQLRKDTNGRVSDVLERVLSSEYEEKRRQMVSSIVQGWREQIEREWKAIGSQFAAGEKLGMPTLTAHGVLIYESIE